MTGQGRGAIAGTGTGHAAGKPRSKGFTLLEILVVLVLLSLIVALLMQGLSSLTRFRGHIFSSVERNRAEMMQEYWFRQVVSGVTADDKVRFEGNFARFSGVSQTSLGGLPGAPRSVAFRLIAEGDQLLLLYQEHGREEWVLGRWLEAKGRFEYLDRDGKWTSEWHVEASDPVTRRIPQLVALLIETPERRKLLMASLGGRIAPKADFRRLDD